MVSEISFSKRFSFPFSASFSLKENKSQNKDNRQSDKQRNIMAIDARNWHWRLNTAPINPDTKAIGNNRSNSRVSVSQNGRVSHFINGIQSRCLNGNRFILKWRWHIFPA